MVTSDKIKLKLKKKDYVIIIIKYNCQEDPQLTVTPQLHKINV